MDVQKIVSKIEDKSLTVFELENALEDTTDSLQLCRVHLVSEALKESGLSDRWFEVIIPSLRKKVFRGL